jgi:hypothetical protein
MHEVLLERFCQRTLDELGAIVRAREGTAQERYRRTYDVLREREREVARAFGDFRRSTAVMQLAIMRRMELLTDEDLSVFSEQTQQTVRGVDSLRNAEGAAPKDGPPTFSESSRAAEGPPSVS